MTMDVGLIFTGVGVLITGVGVIITGVVAIRSNKQIRIREINSRHFLEKKTAYMLFIDVMFKALLYAKDKNQDDKKDLEKGMIAFQRELLVWGNHDVFQSFEKYGKLAIDIDRKGAEDTDRPEHAEFRSTVEKLLRAMRKDLGHDDSQLKDLALVSMLINDEDMGKLFDPNKEN